MKKNFETLYETLGGTYREENGHLIPDVTLPIRSVSMDRCTLTTSRIIVAVGTPLY